MAQSTAVCSEAHACEVLLVSDCVRAQKLNDEGARPPSLTRPKLHYFFGNGTASRAGARVHEDRLRRRSVVEKRQSDLCTKCISAHMCASGKAKETAVQ